MGLREQVREILHRPKTQDRLNEGRRKLFEAARKRSGDKPRDLPRVLAGEVHPCESKDVQAAIIFDDQSYQTPLDAILGELPQPRLVASKDLTDAFCNYLIVPDADYESAYALFCAKLTSEIEETESDPFPVATGFVPYSEETDRIFETLDQMRFDGTICDAGSFKVVGAGLAPGAVSEPKPLLHTPVFYAQVEAEGTQRAVDDLGKHVQDLLPSIIRSRALIGSDLNWKMAFFETSRLPFTGNDGFPWHGDFYKSFLNLSLIETQRKDSMNRRLYNALHLLAQADQQEHPAIALSLACAAMEALVCRKDEDTISSMLSSNTAVLLEPDPAHRQSAAKFIKRLYKKRSDALHGTKLDDENEDRWKTRTIAAFLLDAVRQRQEFLQRMGEDAESPDKFFDELEKLRYRAQQQVTNLDTPHVVSLWRPPQNP